MGRSERVALIHRLGRGLAEAGGSRITIAKTQITFVLTGLACLAVFGSSDAVRAQNAAMPGDAYAAVRDYAQQIGSDEVRPSTLGHSDDAPFAALSDFAQKLSDSHPVAAPSRQIKVADADSLFDALQQFLQKQNGAAPAEQPRPVAPRPARPEEPDIAATVVGSNVCLGCHTAQAEPFSYTLMGRLQKQGKLQCETCHGPGSAHVRAAGCAVCHGDGGITTRPGIPSLVGQDPPYLIVAMKDYITGQRKNALMKTLLTGLSDAEINNIAYYYARQVPARAETPLVGNPSAGKSAIATCAACHGEQGGSVSPAFPSLAGQDAQYLADAIRAYKIGARNKVVACAACHGERGISKTPGTPSLVGLDTQYLIAAMEAYAAGQRNNAVMKALLSGVGDAELNNIALYYAQQVPSRAPTPPVGDVSAGKTASAVCAGCHGEEGVSVSPAFPSLAGQDAQYLADAIRAYKDGSRSKVVACAGCHGEHGISTRPGTPSLVGLDPQYLVAAMKAYVAGQRKNVVMKALLSGVGDAELNNIALYYAQQIPSRAPTPAIGDASAGKSASAACAGCHGAEGVSVNPAWPSLAGQDAKYLAEATEAYKDGSRSDEIMKGVVASLDRDTINNLASYYASLHPEQPSSAKNTPAKPAPVVVANRLLGALDQQTIDNLASYYASLHPEQPSSAKNTPAKPAPVLVENRLLGALDPRTIDNVASYYASLSPAQPEIAKNAPARPVPALVTRAAPVDGLSPGGIISYRPNDPGRTAEQNNAICLTCHERGQRTYWEGSVHQERGVACTNCHTIMAAVSTQGQLKTAFQPDTCFQCHKDRRAQMFRSAHMPMREGKIVCSDCHNPHGSATEGLLWTNSINDTCYKCHAEKRGPFLFEHEPVRENCLNCHDPHGSINEASLKMSRPRLCFECHTIGPHGNLGTAGPFSDLTMSRACNNCHTMIHGSNSPAGGALQR
jgi:DmsE family decaheme c-type cytochrome